MPAVRGGDWAGKKEDCKLRVPELSGGNKTEGDSDDFKADMFEAPEGNAVFMTGYCSGCCIEGGIDKPGGGLSKVCCCGGNPLDGP